MHVLVPFVIAVVVFGGLVGLLYGGRALMQRSHERAVDRTPTKITLKPLASPKWQDDALMSNLTAPLIARGFVDAGSFTLAEIPGAAVRLLCFPDDFTLCAVFENKQGAHWVEMTTLYADGTDACMTTNSTPLPKRPGHWRGHAPGNSSNAVFTQFKQERPATAMVPVTVENAVAQFEKTFAGEAEWRKQTGAPPPTVASPSRAPPSRR